MFNHLLTAYDRNASLLSSLQNQSDDATAPLCKAVTETHDYLHRLIQGHSENLSPDLGLQWSFASLSFRHNDETLAFLCFQLSLFWARNDGISVKRAEQLNGILAKVIESLPRSGQTGLA